MNPVLPSPIESTLMRAPHVSAPHVVARVPAAAPAQTSTREIASKAAAETSQLQQPALTKEQKTEGKLRTLKGWIMLPTQWEIGGMLGGGALGWIAKKFGWERAQAWIAMVAKAPVQALRNTTLAEAVRLPSNMFQEASKEAGLVGGKAKGLSESAAKRADTWMEHATGMTREQLEKATPETKIQGAEGYIVEKAKGPLGKINERLDAIKISDSWKTRAEGFIKGRKDAVGTKHGDAIAKAQEALTTEKVGVRKSIANFFTRNKPGRVDAGELQSVFDDIHASKALSGEAKTKHLGTLIGELEKKIRTKDVLTEGASARAGKAMSHLQKALGSSKTLETFEKATSELSTGASLKTLTSTVGKVLGRVPIFNALLAVGVTVGLGAVLVGSHGESKEATVAFKKLSDELANQPASGFLKSVKAAQKSDKHWRAAKTGIRIVGEVADGLMWAAPHGAGAAVFVGSALPPAIEMIVPGNTVLAALEALDKSDKGQLALQSSDRVQLIAQIIGVVDSVASHGGQYNRLAKAMANEMQERGLKRHDIVQILGNDTAFNAFAAEISAKQQAPITTIPAEMRGPAANDDAPAAAHAHEAKQPEVKTVPVEMRAPAANDDAPKTRIGVGATQAHHKGMVVDHQQRAMA